MKRAALILISSLLVLACLAFPRVSADDPADVALHADFHAAVANGQSSQAAMLSAATAYAAAIGSPNDPVAIHFGMLKIQEALLANLRAELAREEEFYWNLVSEYMFLDAMANDGAGYVVP